MTARLAALLALVAACGAPPGRLAAELGVVGDAGAPAGGTCGSLAFSRSEGEATAAFAALLSEVQAVVPDAYYKEAIDGTHRHATLTGLGVPLAAAHSEDPRPAAIAWLAATSPQRFVAAEWVIDPHGRAIDPQALAVGDVLVGSMLRASIDGVPWPMEYPGRWVEGGGIRFVIEKAAVGWKLRWATLVPASVLATRVDAEALAGCSPPQPGPEELLRAHSYGGYEFSACQPLREYRYTPAAGDTARWKPGLGFALTTGQVDQARWVAFSQVELTIAPANYWPTIAYADCLCDGVAGFTLRVDAVSGAVLRAVPGINCVVC